MRFKKEYFKATSRKIEKYNCIRFDADIEFYVTNCTEAQEPAAIRKAVEKFIEELKKNENTEILVDSLEMMLNFNEYDEKCTFNEIRNGGNAYEIEINRGGEKDLFIYLRICEHGDDITQEEIDRVFEEEIIKEFENKQAESSETYQAWVAMIDTDVISEEFETLSEVIDEIETRYTKEEMRAAGITFCRLLCNAGQWLECLEEKTVDDVYYF